MLDFLTVFEIMLSCIALFGIYLLHFYFFDCFQEKKRKIEKYKNSVSFVDTGTCVPWMVIKTKSLNFAFFIV